MKIEIDFETVDRIVSTEMFEQYYSLKGDIKKQKTNENPEEYQKENLKYSEKVLDACGIMLKHYTAQSKWPEELKDD